MTSTTPPHIYLKQRCRELQCGQTHASIYRAERRRQKHESRLDYVKRAEARARKPNATLVTKLRAKHLRQCWSRDVSYVKRHAERERAEADRVPEPIKAVQTVMHLASEDVIDTDSRLSLLPKEVGERISCFVIG